MNYAGDGGSDGIVRPLRACSVQKLLASLQIERISRLPLRPQFRKGVVKVRGSNSKR